MRVIAAAVLLIAAAMIIGLLRLDAAGRVLTLRDTASGRVYARFFLEPGAEFAVTFTHSVNKTDVTERYALRDGQVVLTGCVYYSFGAGVATELQPGWRFDFGENGEMIISGIDRPLPSLSYVVGTVSDHILTANGSAYSLRALCGRSRSVEFLASAS